MLANPVVRFLRFDHELLQGGVERGNACGQVGIVLLISRWQGDGHQLAQQFAHALAQAF